MAEPTPEPPSDKIKANADLTEIGYDVGITFHPPIKLDRKKAYEFATQLSGYIDPGNVQVTDQAWIFSQQVGDNPAGVLQVSITQAQIQFVSSYASHKLEWIEDRCAEILRIFEAKFRPQLVLNSMANYRASLPIDGDSRRFLLGKVMHVSPSQINLINRPLHLVGMRIACPPYIAAAGEPPANTAGPSVKQVDWGVDVNIESSMENFALIFLAATANWPVSKQWTVGTTVNEVVGHVKTLCEYVRGDLLKFLHKSDESGNMKETND